VIDGEGETAPRRRQLGWIGSVSTGEHTLSERAKDDIARGWAGALSEILVDSGPLIAGFDDTDVWHDECSRLLETLPGPLLVPATIVAEVCYMIGRYQFGAAAEAAFLRSFASRDLVVADLVEDDFERMAQLVEQYEDFPLGGSDASVIAIAERRSITTILTTDRRHFAASGRGTSRHSTSCPSLPSGEGLWLHEATRTVAEADADPR
jgi:uncharacterized protein